MKLLYYFHDLHLLDRPLKTTADLTVTLRLPIDTCTDENRRILWLSTLNVCQLSHSDHHIICYAQCSTDHNAVGGCIATLHCAQKLQHFGKCLGIFPVNFCSPIYCSRIFFICVFLLFAIPCESETETGNLLKRMRNRTFPGHFTRGLYVYSGRYDMI